MNQSTHEERHTLLYIRACEKMKSRLANTVSNPLLQALQNFIDMRGQLYRRNDNKVQRNKSKDRTHIRFSEAA